MNWRITTCDRWTQVQTKHKQSKPTEKGQTQVNKEQHPKSRQTKTRREAQVHLGPWAIVNNTQKGILNKSNNHAPPLPRSTKESHFPNGKKKHPNQKLALRLLSSIRPSRTTIPIATPASKVTKHNRRKGRENGVCKTSLFRRELFHTLPKFFCKPVP